MSAQKLFTLEDLNFGGTNFHNLRPENIFLTWWGDQLIQTDVEECYTIDTKTGKKTLLFTLDDINKWAGSDDDHYVRQLTNATFPYPNEKLVMLGFKKSVILLDFGKKKIVWQDSISGQTAYDWNKTSRATAYVEDDQLFIADGQGKKHQLSTDGSREIVYGQSVHRNEFGIDKGTFWSPDGQHLAFYRMDQSMVTDYPQVDIFPRSASYEPDKYPMAGMTSHKVTVGVYDLGTQKTVYLQTGDPTNRSFTNIEFIIFPVKSYFSRCFSNRLHPQLRTVPFLSSLASATISLPHIHSHNQRVIFLPDTPILLLALSLTVR
jgi:dipeptidyl-peptidase-4